ncbi:hypothetical protein DES32_0823 [Methylovirgula ligni]|uniref:Inner membrane protein n=1 Tax=Methylovirgula ligni TaxID=569860 RepID=A0A3D9ZDQ2_9HYPH|nr:hypothetical protein [Methylovirgula ligni]REF89596.1 hypothetical protein DES32_0823 [Methylovirgula ligni]
MADPEPGEDTGTVPPKPDFSANALRRDTAVIDGTAEDLTPQDSHQESQETADVSEPVAHTALPLSESETTPVEDASESPEPAPEEAPSEPSSPETPPRAGETRPRRGGVLAPALLSLIIGGAAGFGGAYGLRYLDNSDAEINALRVQLAHLEMQQPDVARQNAQTEALANAQSDFGKRLATTEAAVNANADALTALRGEVAKLAARKPVAAVAGAAPDLGPLTQQVTDLQDKLTALTTQVGGLSGSLAAQKSQVTATQNLVAQSAAAHADDTAVALIAGSLLRKAEAGLPFADDLSALAAHGADKAALASLEPAARSGVPASATLAAQFAAESPAILATAPAPHAKGFLDRLLKDAEGLVRIRKIGDTSGDSLAAHVARIQKALDAGAVETAYQQWTALPAPAQQASRDFGTAAKHRLDTIAAARAIEASALANLGKAKS